MVARYQLLLVLFCGFLFVACSQQTAAPVETSRNATPVISSAPSPISHSRPIESERQFLELMIAHHQEAIDRSNEIQERTTTPKLLQFSQNVVEAQQKEVDTMQRWLKLWYGNEADSSTSYVPMMEDLSGLDQKNAERVYLSGMLEHHREAISMAKQVKLKSPRAEVIKLADEIILIQSKEVNLLSLWIMDYEGQNIQQESNPTDH